MMWHATWHDVSNKAECCGVSIEIISYCTLKYNNLVAVLEDRAERKKMVITMRRHLLTIRVQYCGG